MLQLPGVTLLAVDCVNPSLGAAAVHRSMLDIRFGRSKLLSHQRPDGLSDRVAWVQIPKIGSVQAYNRFCLTELHKYVDTPHALTVQSDGFVLHPERWDDAFLQYDYIGAPWPKKLWASKFTQVGNSGFCLRSLRLLKATAALAGRPDMAKLLNAPGLADDVFTCLSAYPQLREQGMTFAPVSLAARFSFEAHVSRSLPTPDTTFGFHGKVCKRTQCLCEALKQGTLDMTACTATGKLRLLVNYYRDSNPERRAEIEDCLQRNATLGLFDDIWVFALPNTVLPRLDGLQFVDYAALPHNHPSGRPTYAQCFYFANQLVGPDDVTVIANNDIYFDESAAALRQLPPRQFCALTRWDMLPGGPKLWEVNNSQDAWAVRGVCEIPNIGFPQGYPGCDNRVAYEAQVAGWKVINPARTIKTCHLHQSNFRRYPANEVNKQQCKDRVPKPYLHFSPTTWDAAMRSPTPTTVIGTDRGKPRILATLR